MIEIGPHTLGGRAVLAPMAGVTDLPFRRLCRQFGAAMVVSEMIISNSDLWDSRKTRLRLCHDAEEQPRSVQIAGSDPGMMAAAARRNVELGAEIIDINMGCPAKKVCRKAAGSALLRDPALVRDILRAVVAAVEVPVTLKIRTGWSPEQRNGVEIAKLAQDCGIAALAVHGRTRECRFSGRAEYDTIARIKAAVGIPVLANGDIGSAEQAQAVLAQTGADGVMIGRAAQGRPWIFREINQRLAGQAVTGVTPEEHQKELEQTALTHLLELHRFYGEQQGLRVARKHIGWYLQGLPAAEAFRGEFNRLDSAQAQIEALHRFFRGETASHNEVIAA